MTPPRTPEAQMRAALDLAGLTPVHLAALDEARQDVIAAAVVLRLVPERDTPDWNAALMRQFDAVDRLRVLAMERPETIDAPVPLWPTGVAS